ncbi:MAG: hypothetical protein WBP81_24105 [Solirubrobacteraceae bacterium]
MIATARWPSLERRFRGASRNFCKPRAVLCIRFSRRALATTITGVACAVLHLLAAAAPAVASNNQVAIIEEDIHLLASPEATSQTLQTFHVRVFVPWSYITRDPTSKRIPSGFDATDPGAYPSGAWDRWDTVVRDAKQLGIAVDFTVTGGAPRWAEGSGIPSQAVNNPNYAW